MNVLSRNLDNPDLNIYYYEGLENDIRNLGSLNKTIFLNDGGGLQKYFTMVKSLVICMVIILISQN